MRMIPRSTLLPVCAVLLSSASALAQTTIDGSAEWTVATNSTTSNAETNGNRAFFQNYALGLSSALFDPRLVRFNTEGLFRTSSLTSGGTLQPDAKGRQGDVGYRFGASILPASSIPFFVQASRTTSNSSGDLGPSNPIRSGMIAPTGAPPVDFESLNKLVNLGWQLNLGSLPRVELGYRQGSSLVTGGGYEAEQNDEDLSATVSKNTKKTRQSFRYQRSAFENQFSQTFSQRLSNLDYDLVADLLKHVQLTARSGRRTTFARSEFSSAVSTSSTGAYVPPRSQGSFGIDYALAGVNYEPNHRFFVRFDGTLDKQIGEEVATTAKLGTLSSSVEVIRGLRLTASGTSGVRGQLVENTPITVRTRSAVGGATYQASVGWLTGNFSATHGIGTNTTPDGRLGSTESWSREVSISTTSSLVGLGAGYERAMSRDAILDYGNYDSERVRASAQTGTRRLSISTSADQLHIERGVAGTFVRNIQHTLSGSASLRVRHDGLVTTSGGGFDNDYSGAMGIGRDRTLFWAVSGQAVLRALRATAWIRSETATAKQTGFDQRALSGSGRLEYRLRLLNVAVEYRQNQSRLQYTALPSPDDFRGRQVRVSVIRQFGFRRR